MILDPEVTIKTMASVVPGELFAFNLKSHRAIGLAAAADPNGVVIIVLRTDETGVPCPIAIDLSNRGHCISFGKDWVLQVRPGLESVPGNRSEWNAPGSIYVGVGGARLYAPWQDGFHHSSGVTFDLATSTIIAEADDGIPHLSWAIWSSAAERDRPGAVPLVEFTGVSKRSA